MPVTHDWDDAEQTIYVLKMEGGDWKWTDYAQAIQDSYQMLGATGRRVHFVMWFADTLPTTGNAISSLRMGGIQPKNIRHTVIINNASRFIELVIESVDRTRGWDGPQIVDSLEEARAYLKARDLEDLEQ